MKKLLFLLAIVASTATGCDQGTTPGQQSISRASESRRVTISDIPQTLDIYNSCCEEWVHLSYTLHVVEEWGTDGQYHYHYNLQDIDASSATSAYHGQGIYNGFANVNGATTTRSHLYWNGVSKSGCSFRMEVTFDLVVDADVAELASISCRL